VDYGGGPRLKSWISKFRLYCVGGLITDNRNPNRAVHCRRRDPVCRDTRDVGRLNFGGVVPFLPTRHYAYLYALALALPCPPNRLHRAVPTDAVAHRAGRRALGFRGQA